MNYPHNVGMHHGASANTAVNIAANIAANTAANTAASAVSVIHTTDAPGCIPTIRTALPQRKNIRAELHDYSGGDYFVTICTRDKIHYFGKIINGEMIYTPLGYEAYHRMETLGTHYSYVEIPLFVVMPNHIHAIIRIRERTDAPGCIPTIRTALGVVVGGYKQSVTRFARRNNIDFGWQARFHDHIIRGNHDGNHISEYIKNNVAHWTQDCFYGE